MRLPASSAVALGYLVEVLMQRKPLFSTILTGQDGGMVLGLAEVKFADHCNKGIDLMGWN